jgi:hypothetical protein
MAPASSPGSSPPNVPSLPPLPQAPIIVLGYETEATWLQTVTVPWEVGWQVAEHYARLLFEHVNPMRRGPTRNGTCIAAALLVLYQEPDANGAMLRVQSKIFLSTIPRGDVNNDLQSNGHRVWRHHSCYSVQPDYPRGGPNPGLQRRQGPTAIHAEDNAINMWLRFMDNNPTIQFLGDMSMVIYGMRRPRPVPARCGRADRTTHCRITIARSYRLARSS